MLSHGQQAPLGTMVPGEEEGMARSKVARKTNSRAVIPRKGFQVRLGLQVMELSGFISPQQDPYAVICLGSGDKIDVYGILETFPNKGISTSVYTPICIKQPPSCSVEF